MKKLIAMAAALLLSASAMFAENAFHLGLAIPFGSVTTDDDVDLSSSAYDFYADWTHIADGGFTFNLNLAGGSGSIEYKDAKDFDIDVSDFFFGAGFGYSFIHDEKMTLSLTGDFGFDFLFGSKDSVDVLNLEFYLGPKVSFTYKILKHFGVFVNAGLYYAAGYTALSRPYYNTSYGYSTTKTEDWNNTGVIFRPEFGIAIPL